jgi:hypothetical protein
MKQAQHRRLFGAVPLALAAWLGASTHAHAGVIHGPVVNPANGHTYYLLSQNDWINAQAEAQTLGGNLVTIRSAAENQWVYDTFSSLGGVDRSLWIGINDQASEGSFVWASGETPGFTLWATGQPDNHINLEHYGHLFPPGWAGEGSWNDYQNLTGFAAYAMHGVVEIAAPCGSFFVTYCTAGTSASNCQVTVSAAGVPSATSSSGFDLVASGVEGGKSGIFFFGANGRQANSWGNGTSYQCVVPPVSRAGLLSGNGTAGLCDGSLAQDLNALWCGTCPKPGKNPGVGAAVQAQLWYRDPLNTSNQTTSLSDAIEFCVAP